MVAGVTSGGGQYAACEFDLPVSGDWHVLVQHASGSNGSYQFTATAIPDIDRGLTAVLSSDVPSIPPAGVFPFTLELSNESTEASHFVLTLSLILPNGFEHPLIPGASLSLPPDSSAAPSINLPLPAGLPSVTFGIGATLTDQESGLLISESYLSFDID